MALGFHVVDIPFGLTSGAKTPLDLGGMNNVPVKGPERADLSCITSLSLSAEGGRCPNLQEFGVQRRLVVDEHGT